jgi:hypothetical protein
VLHSIELLLASILRLFRTRRSLLLENLALRQQLAVLKRKHTRPRLVALDRLFWVLARRFWSGWKQALIIVSLAFGRSNPIGRPRRINEEPMHARSQGRFEFWRRTSFGPSSFINIFYGLGAFSRTDWGRPPS